MALWCMGCTQVVTALWCGTRCVGMGQPPLPWGLDMKQGERHSTQVLAWAAWAFSRKSSNHPCRGQDEAGIPVLLSPILGSAPHMGTGVTSANPTLPCRKLHQEHPKGQTEPLLDSWTMLSLQQPQKTRCTPAFLSLRSQVSRQRWQASMCIVNVYSLMCILTAQGH